MTDIRELKQRLDIIAFAGPYCDGLIKRGNCYQAKTNPLRKEKSSSLYFYADKQKFYDFGSGEHGDVIDFYVKVSGLSMSDVLKQLETKEYLQPIPSPVRSATDNKPAINFTGLFEKFSPLTLLNQNHQQEVLAICPAWMLIEADAESLALFRQYVRYDQINKTLVVSIRDQSGRIVGIKRRRFELNGELKKWVSIKGSETNHCQVRIRTNCDPIFILEGMKDSENSLLLGLDFIALPSANYKTFSQHEMQLLCDRQAIFIADVDAAGIQCMRRLAEQVQSSAECFILDLRKFLADYYPNDFSFPAGKIDFADAVKLHAKIGGKPLFTGYGKCFVKQLLYYIQYIREGGQ